MAVDLCLAGDQWGLGRPACQVAGVVIDEIEAVAEMRALKPRRVPPEYVRQ